MKDYAKRSRNTQTQTDGTWILVLMGLATLLFFGFIVYHFTTNSFSGLKDKVTAHIKDSIHHTIKLAAQQNEKRAETMVTHHEEKVLAAKKKKVVENKTMPADAQPHYDFYKLLPEMRVIIPTEEDHGAGQNKSISTPTATTPLQSGVYVLQIAALQKSNQANQVASALQSSGYKTIVQSYQAPDKTTWYRVLIGPFHQLNTAQTTQNKLYAQKMSALLLKVSS